MVFSQIRRSDRVFIGLGSNVGNRTAYLRAAVQAVASLPDARIVRASSVYETTPIGPSRRDFLNAALEIRTRRSPRQFFADLKKIERVLGRRHRKKWGPREIDLDILLWANRLVRLSKLVIPHPRWKDRKFVLRPLLELAPKLRDPGSGRTVRGIFRRLTDPSQRIKLYRKRRAWTSF